MSLILKRQKMPSENPEMSIRLFEEIKNKCYCHFTCTLWASLVEALALVFFWNSCFFIEQLLSSLLNSCLVISVAVSFNLLNSLFYLKTFKPSGEWGGAREGQAPRTLYMHICIWRGQISTSFGPNINHLIFCEGQILTSKKPCFLNRQKFTFNRQICPVGYFIISIFLATIKLNKNI